MQDENDLTPELTPAERELENALASLAPFATGLRRDELMYAAGARSAHRPLRLWQASAALMAACLGVSLFLRVDPRPSEIARNPAQLVVLPAHPDSTPLANSPYTLASLRHAMLAGDGDPLPPESAARGPAHRPSETPSLRPGASFNQTFGDPS